MKPEEAEELLGKTAAALGEHFEAVQILVSWTEEGLTHCLRQGAGNWYARQGMAHEFINADIAQENARELQRAIGNNPPDDGDEWKNQ